MKPKGEFTGTEHDEAVMYRILDCRSRGACPRVEAEVIEVQQCMRKTADFRQGERSWRLSRLSGADRT
jgi:hypothetical protein